MNKFLGLAKSDIRQPGYQDAGYQGIRISGEE